MGQRMPEVHHDQTARRQVRWHRMRRELSRQAMVMRNICYLLNNFLHCTAYENVIFCWVMHEQSIIDEIISRLDTDHCRVIQISLTVNERNLRNRLSADIAHGFRTADVVERSVARINLYQALDTIKIDTGSKTIREIANEILAL